MVPLMTRVQADTPAWGPVLPPAEYTTISVTAAFNITQAGRMSARASPVVTALTFILATW